MKKLFILIFTVGSYLCSAQQAFYDVAAGNGHGIRFWQPDDNYKIHMGYGSEYLFGPVQDYSIKMNMSDGTPSRGWTWGVAGATPIAALNTLGNMQIAGGFKATSLSVGTQINSRLISLYDSPSDWYGFGIQSNQMRLQVGTANARFSFFAGDTNEVMTVQGNGNVGIGTSSPASMLHLNSTVDARKTFRIYWNNDVTKYLSVWQGTGGAALDPIGTGLLYLGYDQATNVIMGITAAGSNSGNIGIGTATPQEKLHVIGNALVKGQVHANEVKVDLNVPGPDYVFEKDYKLASLEEIKNFIDENKHLPEVPSAKEMEKNGVQLGEMNMLLLKKIEELTLYMIEMKKESESQKQEIQKLSVEVEGLRKK